MLRTDRAQRPLLYLPYSYVFEDLAVLPAQNEAGELITERFTYPRSALDRLRTLGLEWLSYIHLFLAGVSVVCAILACIRWRKKELGRRSAIAFWVSTASFALLMLLALPQYAVY